MLIHPKDISQGAQFAVDQYLLGGGKVVTFSGSFSDCGQTPNPNGNNMMGHSLFLQRIVFWLPEAWSSTRQSGGRPLLCSGNRVSTRCATASKPCFLFVDEQGISSPDVVTSQTDQLMLPFPGGFTGTPAEGLKQTVLLHSTEQSQLVDAFMARLSGEQVLKDFKPSDKEYALAMRLTGQFKTAFPEGKPGAAAEEEDLDSEDPQPPAPEAIKESAEGATVLLFADADFLFDSFGVSQQNFLGARMVQLLTAMCLWCRHR